MKRYNLIFVHNVNLRKKIKINLSLLTFIFLIYGLNVIAECSYCYPKNQKDIMIIDRQFWKNLIEITWNQNNVIKLVGLKQVGKTSLCKSLSDVEYFDCKLKRVRELLVDYKAFFASKADKRIVLDEINKLENFAEILNFAEKFCPDVKIIAVGLSIIDTKINFYNNVMKNNATILLTPILLKEMACFDSLDIAHRFLFGGLPFVFMQKIFPEADFQEWIDSCWAKDIQELYTINKRYSFLKLIDLLQMNSGCMFDATKYSVACELSRESVANYLQILDDMLLVNIVRPFSMYKSIEIVKAPKIYSFDTGFICYAKGWDKLRQDDYDILWEHVVLNEMHGCLQSRAIHYWRDKNDHTIDFVIPNRDQENKVTAIECKFNISPDNLNLRSIGINFKAFRELYPNGENIVVAHNISTSYTRIYKDLIISFVNTKDLIVKLQHANRRD